MARSSTTSDVFNAIGDAHRREILDALIAGEKAVGAIVNDLSMSQPQVSKHLRVLSEVGRHREEHSHDVWVGQIPMFNQFDIAFVSGFIQRTS